LWGKITREMRIKITMGLHCPATRMATAVTVTECWEDVEGLELSSAQAGNVKQSSLFGKQFGALDIVKQVYMLSPSVPVLGVCLREMTTIVHKKGKSENRCSQQLCFLQGAVHKQRHG
jgi:hypothetical protein